MQPERLLLLTAPRPRAQRRPPVRTLVTALASAALAALVAGCPNPQAGGSGVGGSSPLWPTSGPAQLPMASTAAPAPPPPTTARPPTPVPGSTAVMATPVDWSPACTTDNACFFARCNTPFGRCAFPCKTTEGDCKPGSTCNAKGTCVPATPAAPTQ